MALNNAKNNQKSVIKCSFCDKIGHQQNKCWKKNPKNRPIRQNQQSNNKANSDKDISLNSTEEFDED